MTTTLYKLLPRDSSRGLVFRSGLLLVGSSAINEGNFRDFKGKLMSSSSLSSWLSRSLLSASFESWFTWPLHREQVTFRNNKYSNVLAPFCQVSSLHCHRISPVRAASLRVKVQCTRPQELCFVFCVNTDGGLFTKEI